MGGSADAKKEARRARRRLANEQKRLQKKALKEKQESEAREESRLLTSISSNELSSFASILGGGITLSTPRLF